ncbi:MAG: hypothetical protein N3A58_08225, partial [Spirochaetes bacterium]|nr:hypothetical protein [Spirochaetota bacterium]
GVFISGDYAFVSDQSYGIQIIDINTLSIAQIIHSFNTNGSSYNLYYMNNYFYVADGSEGLVILGP